MEEYADLMVPDRPIPPIFPITSTVSDFPSGMRRIQEFINSFKYNYTSNPFVKPKKTGGSRHMIEIYERLLALSLPIQCVEAVFISAILSAPFRDIHRLPLSFESKCEGHIYKHIVLAVFCQGQWGALGISRRDTLMYKALEYPSLWSLIEEFERSYLAVGHTLTLVAPGAPFPHDFESHDLPILWKGLKLRLGAKQSSLSKLELEKFLQSYSLLNSHGDSSSRKKRSNSYTGLPTNAAALAAQVQQPQSSHASSKPSYKAVVMRSKIAAASAACAAPDNTTDKNDNIKDQTSESNANKQPLIKPPLRARATIIADASRNNSGSSKERKVKRVNPTSMSETETKDKNNDINSKSSNASNTVNNTTLQKSPAMEDYLPSPEVSVPSNDSIGMVDAGQTQQETTPPPSIVTDTHPFSAEMQSPLLSPPPPPPPLDRTEDDDGDNRNYSPDNGNVHNNSINNGNKNGSNHVLQGEKPVSFLPHIAHRIRVAQAPTVSMKKR